VPVGARQRDHPERQPAPVTRPRSVPPGLYDAELLSAFAGGEYEAFLAAGGAPLRPRLDRALELAAIRPHATVVDVGCGRGEASVHAALRGARVVALDYSPDALALTARTAGAVAGVALRGAIHRVACAADALPLADESADRVLLLDVVEHLHPWQLAAALGEIRRILRPGAHVVIHTLPNRWALAAAYPLLRRLSRGLPREPRSSYERLVHVNEQSPRSLRAALRAAGLEARVWVEEWTTEHASRATSRSFPDALRERGYPVLRRPIVRRIAALAMRTPARALVGNDIFALAWRGDPPDGLPAH